VVGQGKRADHRVNALLITHPGWVPEPWQACPGSCVEIAGFTCIRTVLASLQDATVLSPANRGSFPLQPWNDPPATFCQPSGLDWPSESNGKTSRPPVPANANPSSMQPCAPGSTRKVRSVEGRSCSAALKSEDRRPKPERRPKSEFREWPNSIGCCSAGVAISSAFGLRVSFGLRSSGLGFGMARTDFRAALAHTTPGRFID